MNLRTVGAWTTAGVAMWASLGALDVTGGPSGGGQRIAMLPSLGTLAASIGVALALGLLLKVRMPREPYPRERPASGDPRPHGTGDSFLPLYALVTLVLPYLPWLPDWVPVLRVFAGPGKLLVWLLVACQIIWAILGAGRGRRIVVRLRAWSPLRGFAVVFTASLMIFGTAAAALMPSGLFPGGDEPHYLIVMQSLLQDRDLKIANNHTQRDYAVYYDGDLSEPHAIAPGTNGETYSVHPLGLPVLAAPAFAAAGYRGVQVLMLVLAAAAAALSWAWVRRVTGSVSAATFAWSATALSLPYLGSAGTVYPEVPAALAVMAALTVGTRDAAVGDRLDTQASRPARAWRAVLLGVATAALPWLHAKYALMSAALLVVGVWRLTRDGASSPGRRLRNVGLAAGIYAAGVAAWLASFYLIWGSPWPSAPYGGAAGTQMGLRHLARGVPGLLVDQEYGVLSYAPAIGIGLLGLSSMWRTGGRTRGIAVELGVSLGALVFTVAAYQMWWGGTALPGRMIVSGLLLLTLPLAWEFRASANRPERRAAYRLLLLVGLAASLTTVVAENGALLALRRDGVSRLLEWLSPDWHLWRFAPDFIMQPWWLGALQAAIWAVAILASAWAVGLLTARGSAVPGSSRTGRGLAFLRANAGALLATLAAVAVMPMALGDALKPNRAPEDRARIRMLDDFDPHGRPVAVRYDPASLIEPASVPREFVLSARPGSRTARQPAAVLLNARFALPAGRYVVELTTQGSDADGEGLAGRLVLQAGRSGGSIAEWDVDGRPDGRWQGLFDLPVDVNFVGFVASDALAQRIGGLRVRPERVVPTLDRTAAYDVLSSVVLGRFVFLFHDGASYAETDGFWVRGQSRAVVSVVSRTGRVTTAVRLRLKSPVANTVQIDTPSQHWTVDLSPGAFTEIEVNPTALDGTLRMVFSPVSGFRPADLEPNTRDRRFLGCWVEIVE